MIAIYLAPLYLLLNVYFLFRILKWLETCHVYFKKMSEVALRAANEGLAAAKSALLPSVDLKSRHVQITAFRGIDQRGFSMPGLSLYLGSLFDEVLDHIQASPLGSLHQNGVAFLVRAIQIRSFSHQHFHSHYVLAP